MSESEAHVGAGSGPGRASRAKSAAPVCGGRAIRTRSAGPTRWALIFAVSGYHSKDVKDLPYAIIDAKKLKATLEEQGWTVQIEEDLELEETKKKMEEFAARRAQGDDIMFAFVGHGVEEPYSLNPEP